MEGEEQKNEPEEQPKIQKPAKLSVTKVKEISSRMLEPVVEEQKAIDKRRIIRAIKDPELVIRGTRQRMLSAEEEAQQSRRSAVDKRESLHSLYKLPGTDIKLANVKADSVGFLECMSGPRLPDFDETESDTTFERCSNDDESEETPSILELMKSDTEEEDGVKKTVKNRKGCKSANQIAEEQEEQENKMLGLKKPKLKRWKPRVKRTAMPPDPLLVEYAQGVTNYLREIGIFCFMKDWLYHLYGTKPRPKDPVKLLRKYLEDSLGNSEQESGVSQLEKELRLTLKKEDDIKVEISKLNHLSHLLAPEIYDADGNMINYEPSIEEEQFVAEEEMVVSQSEENLESSPSNSKVRRTSKSRLVKKAKAKQTAPEMARIPSKTAKVKIKKKKSVQKIPVKGK